MLDGVLTGATPLEPGLFASLDPPQLLGTRCPNCGTVVFPAAGSCPCCSREDMTTVALAVEGRLWSWTVQRIEPKRPYIAPETGFEPFAVGYVDLGELLVESVLLGDPDRFAIGDPVRLQLLAIPASEGDESPLFTYAFARNENAA